MKAVEGGILNNTAYITLTNNLIMSLVGNTLIFTITAKDPRQYLLWRCYKNVWAKAEIRLGFYERLHGGIVDDGDDYDDMLSWGFSC